jgi:hypothetical protein
MRLRFLSSLMFLLAVAAFATPAMAEKVQTLGFGRLFTNDYLGDGRDRWQSGSYVISTLRGPADWTGAPQAFGMIREYRLRGAIVSSDGFGAAPGDRPYAGIVSFGAHTHWGTGTNRSSLGLDLTAIGPQTGASGFQSRAHDVLDIPQVPFTNSQLANDLHFGITAETAEVVPLGPMTTARPFAEVQLGPEDLVRIGADIFFGNDVASDILIRDVTTGHLYRGAEGQDRTGLSLVVGADVAAVGESIYLPENRGVIARTERGRLRAGFHWQSTGDSSMFYGLTYLTPEFEDQPEGQITGSVKLNFNF